MKTKRFKETIIREWDTCKDCPYNEFVSDDYSQDHYECTKTGYYISTHPMSGDTYYTNKDGILDSCPYLQLNKNDENKEKND